MPGRLKLWHLWRVYYCNAVLAESPRVITDKLQTVMNSAARVVSNTRKFDSGLSRLHPLARCHRSSTIQARNAHVSMPPWNCSAVLDGQLYANRRRHWSSTSALCHSAQVDRSALPTEWFRSSAFKFLLRPVDLELAA